MNTKSVNSFVFLLSLLCFSLSAHALVLCVQIISDSYNQENSSASSFNFLRICHFVLKLYCQPKEPAVVGIFQALPCRIGMVETKINF